MALNGPFYAHERRRLPTSSDSPGYVTSCLLQQVHDFQCTPSQVSELIPKLSNMGATPEENEQRRWEVTGAFMDFIAVHTSPRNGPQRLILVAECLLQQEAESQNSGWSADWIERVAIDTCSRLPNPSVTRGHLYNFVLRMRELGLFPELTRPWHTLIEPEVETPTPQPQNAEVAGAAPIEETVTDEQKHPEAPLIPAEETITDEQQHSEAQSTSVEDELREHLVRELHGESDDQLQPEAQNTGVEDSSLDDFFGENDDCDISDIPFGDDDAAEQQDSGMEVQVPQEAPGPTAVTTAQAERSLNLNSAGQNGHTLGQADVLSSSTGLRLPGQVAAQSSSTGLLLPNQVAVNVNNPRDCTINTGPMTNLGSAGGNGKQPESINRISEGQTIIDTTKGDAIPVSNAHTQRNPAPQTTAATASAGASMNPGPTRTNGPTPQQGNAPRAQQQQHLGLTLPPMPAQPVSVQKPTAQNTPNPPAPNVLAHPGPVNTSNGALPQNGVRRGPQNLSTADPIPRLRSRSTRPKQESSPRMAPSPAPSQASVGSVNPGPSQIQQHRQLQMPNGETPQQHHRQAGAPQQSQGPTIIRALNAGNGHPGVNGQQLPSQGLTRQPSQGLVQQHIPMPTGAVPRAPFPGNAQPRANGHQQPSQGASQQRNLMQNGGTPRLPVAGTAHARTKGHQHPTQGPSQQPFQGHTQQQISMPTAGETPRIPVAGNGPPGANGHHHPTQGVTQQRNSMPTGVMQNTQSPMLPPYQGYGNTGPYPNTPRSHGQVNIAPQSGVTNGPSAPSMSVQDMAAYSDLQASRRSQFAGRGGQNFNAAAPYMYQSNHAGFHNGQFPMQQPHGGAPQNSDRPQSHGMPSGSMQQPHRGHSQNNALQVQPGNMQSPYGGFPQPNGVPGQPQSNGMGPDSMHQLYLHTNGAHGQPQSNRMPPNMMQQPYGGPPQINGMYGQPQHNGMPPPNRFPQGHQSPFPAANHGTPQPNMQMQFQAAMNPGQTPLMNAMSTPSNSGRTITPLIQRPTSSSHPGVPNRSQTPRQAQPPQSPFGMQPSAAQGAYLPNNTVPMQLPHPTPGMSSGLNMPSTPRIPGQAPYAPGPSEESRNKPVFVNGEGVRYVTQTKYDQHMAQQQKRRAEDESNGHFHGNGQSGPRKRRSPPRG